ncbi:MAG: thiamine phosphate synthase, partial [Akkermansiaceae bacterium]
MKEIKDARLYGILDMGYTAVENMQSTAESLLQGGVDVLQLRAKGYSEQEVVQLVKNSAPDLLEACHSHGTPLIINDFPQAAVELQADGIHIGQDDGS